MLPTMSAATVAAQNETSKEDGADDEYHPGDDAHPGGGLVDPAGPKFVRRRGWDGCGFGILLNYFSHDAIVADPV